MKKILSAIFLFSLMMPVAFALGQKFEKNSSYEVCFTPGENCTQLLVDLINNAKTSIYVQAYSFTSAPIAKALMEAKRRNIDVRVILDKSQKRERYSSYTFLRNQNIPVWIDYRPAIAHNKIIIFDGRLTATGSFNFTRAAEDKNAENLLIISDKNLAMKYLQNFNIRLSKSIEAYKYYGTESDNLRVRALKRRYNHSSPDVARWFPN